MVLKTSYDLVHGEINNVFEYFERSDSGAEKVLNEINFEGSVKVRRGEKVVWEKSFIDSPKGWRSNLI